MGLLGDRTIGHSASLKPGHNGSHAFHLVDVNTLLRIVEIHQATKILNGLLVIYQSRILLKQLVVPSSCGFL